MSAAVPSIDQLQALALPAPVSYLPHTWGWLALLLTLVLVLAVSAGRRYWRWRHNRYRREALARLAQLEPALNDAQRQIPALRELPELLKRVALSMPGQPAVATLRGEAWQAFLVVHCNLPLAEDFSQQLAQLAYGSDAQLRSLSNAQRQQLLSQCKRWVEHHHVAA